MRPLRGGHFGESSIHAPVETPPAWASRRCAGLPIPQGAQRTGAFGFKSRAKEKEMARQTEALRLTAHMEGLAEFEERLNALFQDCDVRIVIECGRDEEARPCGDDETGCVA